MEEMKSSLSHSNWERDGGKERGTEEGGQRGRGREKEGREREGTGECGCHAVS